MRSILPLLLLSLLLTGCGSSGGGSNPPPQLDIPILIGGVTFLPSTSNRYLPGVANGHSITYTGYGYVEGMTLRLTAMDKAVQGVPSKEIRSTYTNSLGEVVLESRYTYAVSQTNRVYVLEANGMATGPTFIQPLLSSIPTAQLSGYTWTDGYGDDITITYPVPIYQNLGINAISLVGGSSIADYSFDNGFYINIFIDTGTSVSTWVWNVTNPPALEANG